MSTMGPKIVTIEGDPHKFCSDQCVSEYRVDCPTGNYSVRDARPGEIGGDDRCQWCDSEIEEAPNV